MASKIFLPDLGADGIGSAILPGVVTGKNAPSLMLYFRDAGTSAAMLRRITEVASNEGASILQNERRNGFVALTFQPGQYLSRKAYSALGVKSFRLETARLWSDPELASAQAHRFEAACDALGLEDAHFTPEPVGTNRFGEEVEATSLGRILTRKGQRHGEWELTPDGRKKGDSAPDAFFRGTTPQAFSGSARAVAMMIAMGEQFSPSKMANMHRLIMEHDPDAGTKAGFRPADLLEGIEAHLASMIAARSLRSADPREVVSVIDDSMASHTERSAVRMIYQQYSTPFPIGRVAAETLMPQHGETLLEPTIGNAALVSNFLARRVDITGIELDPRRAARARQVFATQNDRMSDLSVIDGDFIERAAELQSAGQKFDLIVANPPFGKLDKPTTFTDKAGRNIPIRTLHHQIAVESLALRNADGRAFLVMPGSLFREGKIEGADMYFDNWLRSTYEVAGSASVDGRLYRKMGTEYPVVIYAIGPERETPLTAAEVEAVAQKEHRIIMTRDELFAWSDETQAKMKDLFAERGLDFVDYPDIRKHGSLGQQVLPTPAPAPASEPVAETKPDASPAPAPERPTLTAEPETAAPASPQRRPTPSGDRVRGPARAQPVSAPDAPVPVAAASPVAPEPRKIPREAPGQQLYDDIEDDVFSLSYESASNSGQATTRIQKSLQGLVYRALRDVTIKHGDVDEYVAGKLGLTVDDLPARLSPEQIDALALNYARAEEGRGFLNSDLMGVGKGRFLAATIMQAINDGRPVMFMTEKPTLFSDMIARDLAAVSQKSPAELGKGDWINPYIMNQDARNSTVRDMETDQKIFGVGKEKDAKTFGIPTENNAVLATYSQFQMSRVTWKLDAVMDWMTRQNNETGKGPLLVLDEAHCAAGETSNTGERIEALVQKVTDLGGTVTYSSATPLKSGRNIKIFSPILPDLGMSTENLITLIEQNPLALQEVLASEMARMGTTISREVDSRGATRTFVPLVDIDPERHQKITRAVDAVSEILLEMVEKAPLISENAKSMAGVSSVQSVENKVTVNTTSPVSQFHTLCQYMMTGVKTAYAKDLFVQAIAQGKKPVAVFETTGQSIMERMVNRAIKDGSFINGPNGTQQVYLSRLPDLGDIIVENVEKMLEATIKDSFGEEQTVRVKGFDSWVQSVNARVTLAREQGLSELCVAPFDKISEIAREISEESGGNFHVTAGEITGRKMNAVRQEDGRYLVETREKGNTQATVRAFNNGELDLVSMNASAAVGISMQASPAVGYDLRQRVMIKFAMLSSITAERQIDGRINRFGQVKDAEYWIPMSGYAADDRLVQLFNKKNRSLSATSSASRENATNINEGVDLLNPVGEGVVRDYLREHAPLAVMLGLPIPGEDAASMAIDSYARRMMGRLIAMPVDQQNVILSELDTQFRMRIEALDAAGQNPLRLNQFDWKARSTVVSQIQAGQDNAEEIGKRPVNLVKLTYTEKLETITGDKLARLVDRGLESAAAGTGSALTPREVVGAFFDDRGKPDFGAAAWDKAMGRDLTSLGAQPVTIEEANDLWDRKGGVDQATAKVWEKRLLRFFDYAEFLEDHIDTLRPGSIVNIRSSYFPGIVGNSTLSGELERQAQTDELREKGATANGSNVPSIPAVITRVKYNPEDPLTLGGWVVGMAVPGTGHVEEITLSSAFTSLQGQIENDDKTRPIQRKFFTYSGAAYELMKTIDGVSAPADLSENLRLVKPDPAYFNYQNSSWRPYIDKLFDSAPRGDIRRTSYALEGNMFVAMHLSQMGRQKLGQKAIYTTHTGEIRHAVILKKGESIDKLTATLQERKESLSTKVPMQHPEVLAAAMRLYIDVQKITNLKSWSNRGDIFPGAPVDQPLPYYDFRNRLDRDLATVLSRGLGGDAFSDYVAENRVKLVTQIALSMKSNSLSELYIGGDTLSETNGSDDGSPGSTYVDLIPTHTDPNVQVPRVSQSVRPDTLTRRAQFISGNDLHLLIAREGRIAMLFDKTGKSVIAEAQKVFTGDFLDQSGNRLFGTRITKGTLAFEPIFAANPQDTTDQSRKTANLLLEVAKVEGSPLQMRGGIGNAFNRMEELASEAHTLIAERNLEQDAENTRNNPMN